MYLRKLISVFRDTPSVNNDSPAGKNEGMWSGGIYTRSVINSFKQDFSLLQEDISSELTLPEWFKDIGANAKTFSIVVDSIRPWIYVPSVAAVGPGGWAVEYRSWLASPDNRSKALSALMCDSIAGITVAITLVPQGLAYAALAGLPPVYGLYSSIVPAIVYSLYGTSSSLNVGPVGN